MKTKIEKSIIVKEEIKEIKMKELIEFTEFLDISSKLEIKVGLILNVEDVPKSNKLLKLTVNFGDEKPRTVVTNIKSLLNSVKVSGELVKLGGLVGLKMLFVTNLKPVTMMGIESTAMIMPGDLDNGLFVSVNGSCGTSMI